MAPLKIKYANDDINYFNGFRNASKLLNAMFQYLQGAIDEVPENKLRATVEAWRKAAGSDMSDIVQGMYSDLKDLYGMKLRVDTDDTYYLRDDLDNAGKN